MSWGRRGKPTPPKKDNQGYVKAADYAKYVGEMHAKARRTEARKQRKKGGK